MTEITEEIAEDEGIKKLYQPSWVNGILDWIESRPVPSWVIYLGIYLLSAAYIGLLFLSESVAALYENLGSIFLNGIWLAFSLACLQYIIRAADRVVDRFHPLMNCSRKELEKMRTRMTKIPQRVAVIIPLILGPIIYYDALWGSSSIIGDLHTPAALILGPIFPVFGFSFIPLLIYLTLRQLHTVSQMYTRVKDINIFHLQPLYIPSTLTARTGVIWILYLNIDILVSGLGGTTEPALVVTVAAINSLLAISAFVIPLWGIHRKIVREKERALEENSTLIEDAYSELKQFLAERNYQRMDQLKEGISSLFSYRAELEKTPTWPWQPETFRGFLSAVFLPLLIWIVQRLLTPLF